MAFWDTNEGDAITKETTSTDYEVSTAMAPIPDGSVLKAIPTEAKWAEYEGDRYINIRWDVIDGEFKSRVIFHKIRVMSAKATQKDKALRMLAAIDANAGGKLMELSGEPTDQQLSYLCNKPMEIRVRIWEMNDKVGNWVEAVSSAGAKAPQPAPAKQEETGADGPSW